jgi:hypothetical protein
MTGRVQSPTHKQFRSPISPLWRAFLWLSQSAFHEYVAGCFGSSHEWYLNGNKLEATSQQIQVSERGSYTVKVSLDNCSSPLSQILEYEKITTGIDEELAQIKIYPNPAIGSVFVEFPRELNIEITILDAVGRTLKIDRLTNQQQKSELSLAGIKAGIYFLQIQTTKGVLIRKLIVR